MVSLYRSQFNPCRAHLPYVRNLGRQYWCSAQQLVLVWFGSGTFLSTVRCFRRKYTFSALGRSEWRLFKAVSSSVPWIIPILLWNSAFWKWPLSVYLCISAPYLSANSFCPFQGKGRRTELPTDPNSTIAQWHFHWIFFHCQSPLKNLEGHREGSRKPCPSQWFV